MKRNLFLSLALVTGFFSSWPAVASDNERPGNVVWSDGRKVVGTISLTPGKDLRLFTTTGQVSVPLAQTKEILFQPEKEEMREGFYFPNAGQATQAKTGEVYPVRYLKTEITLGDGRKLEGHLFTTTLYVESDEGTEKVVLMAKQTGADGQKLADLPFPASIQFDGIAPSAGSSRIDLTSAGFSHPGPPLVVGRPDLSILPAQEMPGQPVWTVPSRHALLFSVTAADGIHVAWPAAAVDATTQATMEKALQDMQDFYDTRTLLGCFADPDGGDVYTLVMMQRLGTTYGMDVDKKPWSLVILRWKYDSGQKRATLLNRVSLGMGRSDDKNPRPAVLKSADLLMDISSSPATNAPASP